MLTRTPCATPPPCLAACSPHGCSRCSHAKRDGAIKSGHNHTDVEAEDLAIQEHERAERLTLCGGTDPAFHGEPRQKRCDLGRSHRRGMLLVVEEDIPPD